MMRKTVAVFGLLSGAVSSAMMLLTLPFLDRIGFEHGEILGYTLIVASFLPVYFGIRSYRDGVGGGSVTFGRAFTIGILICAISSACYVATWELIYYKLSPDFVDKFEAYAMDHARATGASPQEIEAKAKQMAQLRALYANPLTNAAVTFLEPFPVGLLISLISAGILSRARRAKTVAAGAVV